jgi:hypothetical protein
VKAGALARADPARLAGLVRRSPEAFLRVVGRSKTPQRLHSHLAYISRDGALPLEDRQGDRVAGRAALGELAKDWIAEAEPARTRRDSPITLSIVLSMPPPTDAAIVRRAVRDFARTTFADRFDYVFVLHADRPQPHVHMVVRADGARGARLNPTLADLQAWRGAFARALREQGLEAEASPRRLRGLTRKSEDPVVRRMRLRWASEQGEAPRKLRAAYHEAARAVFLGETAPNAFEARMVEQQSELRAAYRQLALRLQRSANARAHAIGLEIEAFVRAMPAPDSQRLALARHLRAERQAELAKAALERGARERLAKDRDR